MGMPIVGESAQGGFDVTVLLTSTSTRAEALARLGARASADIAGLAASTQLIFSIIPDDAALRTVALGRKG